ncbi:MAG: DUF819 family protein [Acidimicrobiia bacterium]|nr:DUF819 family protein [Acidimicrobiia bacterium]
MGTIVLALVFVGFPALAVYGANRNKVLEWLSPVVLCYSFGILLGNIPGWTPDTELANSVTEITVLLAIPLLLFSTDFPKWLRMAPKAVLSFGLATLAVMVGAAAATVILSSQDPETWKMAGMTVGVYTGGTPNMSAIGLALEVTDEKFVLVNGADVVLSAVYLLFLMTIAQRVLLRFLPAYSRADVGDTPHPSGMEADPVLALKTQPKAVAGAIGLSVLIAGMTVGIVSIFDGSLPIAPVILSVTTLGIALSFVPRIRNLAGTYETGQYLLLVFAVAIGTLANIREMADAFSTVFVFVAIVLGASILFHYLLAALFRIDADTVLITSTAAVFGPAFVGPIAAVLKNREIVVSGLTTGVVGYAVGNYAGLAIAYLLQP